MLNVNRPQQRARNAVERQLTVGPPHQRVGRCMKRRLARQPYQQCSEHCDQHDAREAEHFPGGRDGARMLTGVRV